jgi:hypothetical protein
MSTLQISLAVIGAVLLALIVAYNAWTNHNNAPRRAERSDAPRQEPAFDGVAPLPDLADAQGQAPPEDGDGDFAATMPDDGALALPPMHGSERRLALDALIDAIAPLSLDHLVSGDAALAALPPTRRAGSKPFAIEGLNETSGHWETPAPGQRYRAFQAGVQLANRTGALNEIEFSEFVAKTQAFADAVGAAPDFPDMLHEVARARELDQFASDHDAQLAFAVRARQAAWSPGYVHQNAARAGFVAGALPGRMVLPAVGEGGGTVLTLAFDTQAALSDDPEQSAVRELLLSLDVAQVDRSEQAFSRLREAARLLCDSMDAVLCDQNGVPLPAMAMDPIAADLELLYDQLDGRDLSAGSPQARRVFS